MNEATGTLAERVAHLTDEDGIHATEVPRLHLIRSAQPTEKFHVLHEPAFCLVLQGRKRVMLAEETFEYGPSRFLIVSFDLPLAGQVVAASPEQPYLCLKLDIEPAILSSLMADMAWEKGAPAGGGPGLMLGDATAGILDAAARLIRLIEAPGDIPILAPMLERELLYRILQGPHADHLRSLAFGLGRSRQIARAISWIKENYRAPFNMAEVASQARLSTSALHSHFKSVTLMSPLQYQKRLRLQEARRRMLLNGEDAASAGFAVGYESPSQFNREYRRLYGESPLRDVKRMIAASDFTTSL